MKKILTTSYLSLFTFALLSVVLSGGLNAQNPIPNPDFEEWSNNEPVGWNSLNQNILGTDFITVSRDQSNPQSGTSCVKVQTVMHNIFIVGPVTLPGILSLGEITVDIINQTGSVEGGVPIETRPNILTGWYRNQLTADDASIIGIGLFRWNGSSRDTLALGYNIFGEQTNAWQKFSIPIDYMMWEMPDTMNIMFFSSNLLSGSMVSGSTIWVDNISLEYGPVATNNAIAAAAPSVRPASGQHLFTLTGMGSDVSGISIFSLSGSCVMRLKPSPGQREIDINASGLKAGLYILRIENNDGSFKSLKFNSI